MSRETPIEMVRLEPIPASRRRVIERSFRILCTTVSLLSVVLLVTLIGAILWQGLPRLSWNFITGMSSRDPEKAGILGALIGSALVCVTCAAATLPIGVATAIFLEEYRPQRRWLNVLHRQLELLISNLAGVPSVVYGLLGLSAFVHLFGLFGTIQEPFFEIGVRRYHQYESEAEDRMILIPSERDDAPTAPVEGLTVYTSDLRSFSLRTIDRDAPRVEDPKLARRTIRQGTVGSPTRRTAWYYLRLPFGYTVLAGALTLMLVVLPVVIIASQEAVRAVPGSLRAAALGLGCTRWQVVRSVTLPSATPGIMTGAILAMSRAIGEAAPILLVSGVLYLSSVPKGLMSEYTVMPLQIFQWADDHEREFADLAASGIIVLLVLLTLMNLSAVLVRQRAQRRLH
jgi:phosphate transport system permease protein